MQLQENLSDSDSQDNQEKYAGARTTDEIISSVKDDIKMVKQDTKNMLHRSLTPILEGGKESAMTTQHEIIMEELITNNCEEINKLLNDNGYEQIEMVVFPQFCKMLSVEQIKDTIKRILSNKSTQNAPNMDEQLISKIKILEEENSRLRELAIENTSQLDKEKEAFYNQQIDTLSETLKKYKTVIEIERRKDDMNSMKNTSFTSKVEDLEYKLEQKSQIIDSLLTEKKDLLTQVKKSKRAAEQFESYKIENDQLSSKVNSLLKSNTLLQSQNLQLSSSVKGLHKVDTNFSDFKQRKFSGSTDIYQRIIEELCKTLSTASPYDLVDSVNKISKIIEVTKNMEQFIKKISTLVSHGNSDKTAILSTLYTWKEAYEEYLIVQKALIKISNLMYENKEQKSLSQQLKDIEQRIGENQELLEFSKAVELMFHQPISSQLLDEISDCINFRNILSPYIVKYTELLNNPDSAKCLEEIVKILEERA